MVYYDQISNNPDSFADCMSNAAEDGYTENFKVIENRLTTDHGDNSYDPGEVNIEETFRFESRSGNADDTAVYWVETIDGVRGTLIDANTADTDTKLSAFIRSVDDTKRKSVESGRRSWKEFLRGY